MGARPQPDRIHRGKHSYTVKTAIRGLDDEMHEVLVDILLRTKAYYVKKAGPDGRCGQITWKKHGGAKAAWSVTMDQARCGGVLK